MSERNSVYDFYSVWAQGTALYGKWATSQEISYTELSILYALATEGLATQKSISELYGLAKQTVNNTIRFFEKEKYVRLEVNEKDKREKIIRLTESGSKYCENKLASLFEIEEYICSNINSDRFKQAIETRKLFNTLFEKEMERILKEHE